MGVDAGIPRRTRPHPHPGHGGRARAPCAQISPITINSLAAIASFVRTDPDRARELLLDFADFTRYALRTGGVHDPGGGTAQRRAGPPSSNKRALGSACHRLARRPRGVAGPGALSRRSATRGERRVRHGLADKVGTGHVTITAVDQAPTPRSRSRTTEAVGADPEAIHGSDGAHSRDSVGLGNVDARLRQVYGDDFGLVVETAPGAGTKVPSSIPKFAPAAHAPTGSRS